MANGNGGTGANFPSTIFDDQATTAISSGNAPFNGSFRPVGLLSSFNGKSANGVWTLTVKSSNTTSGTLSNWSLQVLNPTEPSDTTGTDGVYDLSVSPGTHHIREVAQPGFTETAPTGGVNTVTVLTGQNSVGNNFGNLASSISGTVFSDSNANGVLDPGEPGVADGVYDDLNDNGVWDTTSQYTVSSADVNKSIGAVATVLSTTVADDLAGAITDLNVNLTLNDTKDSNLSVTLIGPDGTSVVLLNHVGGTGVNFVNTTLDDQASTAITSGSAPFNGSFRPSSALSAFNAKNPDGTWRLLVVDTASPNTGTLVSWSLQFTTNAPEPLIETNPDGTYQIAPLTAGAHHIRQFVPVPDTVATSPAGGAYDVVISSSQLAITNGNFGNHAASVGGTVFLDANQDDQFDAGDSGLAGWFVYDDENDDGVYSQPVTSVIPAVDDPQPINGLSTTTSDIVVSGASGSIDNVVLNLTLHFPHVEDLSIVLTDPDGNSVEVDNVSTIGANMINTTFDDASSTPLSQGTAPYTGTFEPVNALATLDGDDANGVWQLQVTNDDQTTTGTLDGWNLQLTSGVTEPSTLTASDGSYQLNNLPEGDQHIRVVPPAGFAETSPASGVYDETLDTGAYVTGDNFGFIQQTSATPSAPGATRGERYRSFEQRRHHAAQQRRFFEQA